MICLASIHPNVAMPSTPVMVEHLESRDTPSQVGPHGGGNTQAVAVVHDPANAAAGAIPVTPQARNVSQLLNENTRLFRLELQSHPKGSLGYTVTEQALRLTAAERSHWDETWRVIGVPGTSYLAKQDRLFQQQEAFIKANADLLALQKQEIAFQQISTYTVPAF